MRNTLTHNDAVILTLAGAQYTTSVMTVVPATGL